VTPTADDYANLLFCESFEEEDARANLTITEDERSNEPSATALTTTSLTRNKKKRRRVSFGASIPTFHLLHDVPPVHAMTADERSTLWFSRSDLEMLKSSAQSSIQDTRNRIIGNAQEYGRDRSKFRSTMLMLEQETDSSIRGLEHRVFRRKRTRQMLIRDVLECQAHARGLARFGHEMDGKEKAMLLANVSRERSVKAYTVAFVDAKDDYEEVYGDEHGKLQKKQARHGSLVSLS